MKTYIGAVGSVPTQQNTLDVGKVYVNSFRGDSYHSFNTDQDEEKAELRSKIDQIKHINKDVDSYRESVILYEDYMESLEDKYGGKELFELARKNGFVKEKIPPRPEFKVTRKNRDTWKVIKNGGALSRVGDLSISEEKENDYLRRIGFDPEETEYIPGKQHSDELNALIKKEVKGLIDCYDEDYFKIEHSRYVDNMSLGEYLDSEYGENPDNLDFEVTLKDIWEDTPRYRALRERREVEEKVDFHINTSWTKCSQSEINLINAFEQGGWCLEKLSDKISETAVSNRLKTAARSKKNKKKKKKQEIKFKEMEVDSYQSAEDLLKEFNEFTSEYFDMTADNILFK